MVYFSVNVPYDPMDFRAVCQCCSEHKELDPKAWCKKHDKKNQTNKKAQKQINKKMFLRHSFSRTAKSQIVNLCVFRCQFSVLNVS